MDRYSRLRRCMLDRGCKGLARRLEEGERQSDCIYIYIYMMLIVIDWMAWVTSALLFNLLTVPIDIPSTLSCSNVGTGLGTWVRDAGLT